jgi:hypothetical protein
MSTLNINPTGVVSTELLVKVNMQDKGISTAMRFEPNITVEDAISRILRKQPVKNPSSYGLFVLSPDNKNAFLMDEVNTLNECRLKDNVRNHLHHQSSFEVNRRVRS